MAARTSQRAGARLAPSSRILTDYGRRRLEAKRETLRSLLVKQEEAYQAGNRGALALGIKISGLLGEPLPAWIVSAWSKACTDVAERKIASWDQVLGNESPKSEKGRRRDQIERERLGKLADVLPFLSHVQIRKGDPQGSFFWHAARHLNIGPAAARKLYYKLPPQHRPARRKKGA